ncbi:MAG: succinate dehydrogenase assembly factor 2 [Gammaproteobacteria bacterium]|jgi:antitoxin CptB|nr:succinate dehydrogenase assembly factor 2 [Gammaproteobacteria bacterium]MBU0827917.1 succinate dehydrogenase assembly factor 2 [Gammaproteobacteria bacterium]MBU0892776.1 succinate dehydrogenase assembly factor 2 [Gammaproteobacteria bacterium]MBU1817502.1 succinate dehydrogenase assembly factor 2 [Gammaproteobacteria bacterium]
MGETATTATAAASPLLTERELSKLHWRCRRGLLENDLFIEQFFAHFEPELTQRHAQGLAALMDLADNDLLDLLLRRKEPEEALDAPEVHEVLGMLRQSGGTPVLVS